MTLESASRGRLFKRGALEMAVIVLGVLIALWADQWWADRKDAETERAYLAALNDDIATALEELDQVSAEVALWHAAASTLSSMPLNGPYPANDSLVQLIGDALFNVTSFDNTLSTHQDLKSTGRLGLISDPEIRRGLAEVDRHLETIRFQERDLMGAQHATIDGFLVARTDLAAVAEAGFPDASEAIGEGTGLDHTDLIGDREFRGVVALRVVIVQEMLRKYRALRDHLLSLRGAIRATLEP